MLQFTRSPVLGLEGRIDGGFYVNHFNTLLQIFPTLAALVFTIQPSVTFPQFWHFNRINPLSFSERSYRKSWPWKKQWKLNIIREPLELGDGLVNLLNLFHSPTQGTMTVALKNEITVSLKCQKDEFLVF